MKGNFKLVLSLVFVLAIQLSLALKVSDAQTCPAPDPVTRDSRFITGPEFLNNNSWTTEEQILLFLKQPKINSWLLGPKGDGIIQDVDVNRTPLNFPEEILKAARDPLGLSGVSPRPINPQLLIAKVQSENGLLLRRTRPSDRDLAKIMNCGNPSTIRGQIQCAAKTLRAGLNGFDNLAACRTDTPYGVDRITQTKDGVNVKPKNAATGAIFGYTDEAGIQWGGISDPPVGGTANFCGVWNSPRYLELGVFAKPPTTLTLALTNPTLTCSDPLGPPDRRNVTFSVAGGTPGPNGYTWTVTTNITPTNAIIQRCGQLGEDAVLKPPENRGSGVAGTAYKKQVTITTPGHTSGNNHQATAMTAPYDCSGLFIAAPGCVDTLSCGGVSDTNLVFQGDSTQCSDHAGHPVAYPPSGNVVTCDNVNPSSDTCVIAQAHGKVCNTRTQAMINAECRPCRLEMQGATVTVTDATGPPVSTPVAVQ